MDQPSTDRFSRSEMIKLYRRVMFLERCIIRNGLDLPPPIKGEAYMTRKVAPWTGAGYLDELQPSGPGLLGVFAWVFGRNPIPRRGQSMCKVRINPTPVRGEPVEPRTGGPSTSSGRTEELTCAPTLHKPCAGAKED